eukprot:SAG31_NODE_3623_length_4058_cov_5.815863_4_plen_251_part_00
MRVLELALSLATFAIGARGGGGASATCTHRAADVARAAAHTCGILPVEEALRAVRMPAAAARRAGEMLAELGFGTALDLELLGGRESAAEVLAELKAGGLGPADRAKVRLLVGDREHSRRLTTDSTKHTGTGRRVLQSSGADSGMSTDTIAIVLSVLVGAAGYVVQVAQTPQFLSFSLHGRLSLSFAVPFLQFCFVVLSAFIFLFFSVDFTVSTCSFCLRIYRLPPFGFIVYPLFSISPWFLLSSRVERN